MINITHLEGRELDVAVAERVMGWVRGQRWGNGNGGWTIDGKPYEEHRVSWDHTPKFSADIAAAMQVVEKLRAKDWWTRIWSAGANMWTVEFSWMSQLMGHAISESLPEAICLAALATVESEDKQRD